MPTNPEAIYDRYQRADFTDRLNIFLQFPVLRLGFTEIDQKEEQRQQENRNEGHNHKCSAM